MKKFLVAILLLVIAAFLVLGHKTYKNADELYESMQAKHKAYENLYFLVKMTLSNIETQSVVRKRGDLIRIESSLDGGKTYPTVAIKTKDASYTYVPSISTAYETSANIEEQLNFLEWGANISDARIGKRTTKNREKCIMVDTIKGNEETSYCISEKYGIPVFMETKSPDGSVYASYNIMFISTNKIPEVYFKLPTKVKVIKNIM